MFSKYSAIKIGLPVLVGLAIPFAAKFTAQWAGHPDWRDPLIFGFLIGSVLTAIYLLPSASALHKSIENSQRATEALLKDINARGPIDERKGLRFR